MRVLLRYRGDRRALRAFEERQELVKAGLTRDEAYGLVQRNALAAWDEEHDFHELVASDPEIRARLDADALAEAFDLGAALQHLDVLFERLGALAEKTRERKEEAVHA